MTVYGIRTCDTCRKAVKALEAAGYSAVLHDVRVDPVGTDRLMVWIDAFGDDLVNRRSTTWRGLDDAARAMPTAALLAAHPSVMKRPVIDTGAALHLGWAKPVQAALAI
ncbi:arsenate reductase [Meridianimarinicoccus roseus]|uniref:Arsenate reductase n=1 Tax=Meridianimarinicoccus roseus TaxID=2072018 RepID=A0A2V2LRZ4_9RHOB|nr:ArsC/Spx/MgsR family protein [Meridianimarinicoccus roseus]PWR04223.1 arsenate reductase [Meridianimarinicoccus roseus]